jgi:hypothetical protein
MDRIVKDYSGNLRSMGSLPLWAQDAIIAGAYQQGKAEAFKYAFDTAIGRIAQR